MLAHHTYIERLSCMRILKAFANLKIFTIWERKGIKVKYLKFYLLIVFFNGEKVKLWCCDNAIIIGIIGRF